MFNPEALQRLVTRINRNETEGLPACLTNGCTPTAALVHAGVQYAHAKGAFLLQLLGWRACAWVCFNIMREWYRVHAGIL